MGIYDFNNFNLFGLNNYAMFNPYFMPSFFNFNPWGMNQGFGFFPPLFDFSNYNNVSSTNTNSDKSTTNKTTTEKTSTPKKTTGNVNVDRIIEYNKTNYSPDYYGVVDKKTCTLSIYNKDGKVVKSYILGLGADKGDGIAHNGQGGRLTTAGEFTLDENVSLVGEQNYREGNKLNFMALKGDNVGDAGSQAGIHMIPKNLLSKRTPWMDSKTLNDNRMSKGCVNMYQADYEDMYNKYLRGGCKIYILPEDNRNELVLRTQADGISKFVVEPKKQVASNETGCKMDVAA